MNIKETAIEIHENNIKKGFSNRRGEKRNVGEILMLVVSELSEALEADRERKYANVETFMSGRGNQPFEVVFRETIKNSFEDEIADAVIRLFDISEEYGFDLEWHIRQKMNYNALRPYKHGKAY